MLRRLLLLGLIIGFTFILCTCGLIDLNLTDVNNITTPVEKSPSAIQPGPRYTMPEKDTEGTIKVKWSATGGTARTDMLGVLDETQLLLDGDRLIAKRTVEFTPTSPNAVSTSGKYIYSRIAEI